MLLLLLLLPAVCFAVNDFPEPDPSEMVTFYNSLCTGIDVNAIIDALYDVYGYPLNIADIPHRIDYNSGTQVSSIHIDKLHYDWDTSATYGNDVAVSLPGDEVYVLQAIAQWFDADSANRWGKVKYIQLVGFALKVRGNSQVGILPEDTDITYGLAKTTLYRSTASYIWTHLHPGVENNGSLSDTLFRTNNPYYTQALTGNFSFVPGALNIITGTTPPDTTKMWVALPTYLDGNTTQDVLDMLTRSQSHIIPASGVARSGVWAVFDQSGASTLYTDVEDSIQKVFPNQVLADIDSVDAAGTDTVYLGWSGDITLQAGDSCAILMTSASKHSPRPSQSNIWYHLFEPPIVPGALTWTYESLPAYTIRDTSLRNPSVKEQTLLCDAINQGFTYGLGNCFEPYTSGIPQGKTIVGAIRVPHLPFALVASAAFQYCKYSEVAIGPAIGYFRPALTASSETVTFTGACSEAVSYSGTMPASADSILFTRITASSETLITRVNTSPGGAVNQTISNLWRDKPLERVLVTIVDTLNVHHTTEFIAP